MVQLRQIDAACGSESEPDISKFSRLSVLIGAGTVYECGIQTGRRLQGIQKRKFFSDCALTWSSMVKGLPGDDPSPSASVLPALFALRVTTGGKPEKSGKAAAVMVESQG